VVAACPHWLWNGLIYVPFMVLVFLLALILGDSFLAQMHGKAGLARLAGAFQATLGLAMVVGTVHLGLMALIPKLTRALGLGFGQESVVDNLLVDIRSTPTPGSFPGLTERRFTSVEGGWLLHSRLYEAGESIADIARFIRAGAALPGESGQSEADGPANRQPGLGNQRR
jgi:hypothetical protein